MELIESSEDFLWLKNDLLAKNEADIPRPRNRSPIRKKDFLVKVLMDLILLASGMSS